jgi:hypothetical protein
MRAEMEYREKLIITSLIDEHAHKEIDERGWGGKNELDKLIDYLNELTRLKKKIWNENI